MTKMKATHLSEMFDRAYNAQRRKLLEATMVDEINLHEAALEALHELKIQCHNVRMEVLEERNKV